ncbi:MAG: transcription elongation factor GreA [Succinivibrionaceae bacterium]|nr:transcription elongation factor GreA [Succinivibrionaceae bacterium]
MDKVPMTVRGAELLRAELEKLKTVDRPQVVQEIAEAREHGDLKENAEYHAAREQQGMIEARIRDIEGKLSNAQIIDVTKIPNDGRVVFGCTVTVYREDQDKEIVYKIVGEDEADLKQNLISVYTPIAKGLIGKEIDDEVVIKVPAGEIKLEIVDVKYV